MTTRKRMAWPDVAKGISILGVVTLHASLAVPEGMDTTLARVNTLLDPLRMPLFFLVSGFFATKVFRFSFRQLFARRLWFFLVPYVLWVPVELWLKYREYALVFGTDPLPWQGYLRHVLEGDNMAWFLYALVVFNIVLWLTRHLPSWAVALVAFSPLLLLPLHYEFHMVGKAVLYLPIFLGGAYLRSVITRFAETALSPSRLVISAGSYAVAVSILLTWNRAAAHYGADLSVPWPLPFAESVGAPELRLPVMTVVQILMLPTAVLLAVIIARIPYLSTALQYLGRNTLVIYISHPIAITVAYHYLQVQLQIPISRDADTLWHWTGFWIGYIFLVSAIGAILFWLLARVPVLGWTITPPPLHRPAPVARQEQRPSVADAHLPTGASTRRRP